MFYFNQIPFKFPIILLLFDRIQCSNTLRFDSIKKKKNIDGVSRNVTRMLNTLLRGYDKRVRPNYSGILAK